MESLVPIDKVREKLVSLRVQAGLTAEELAEKFGKTYSSEIIRAVEDGRRSLGIVLLAKYAEVFDLDIFVDFKKKE